jgi:hypothetical protein
MTILDKWLGREAPEDPAQWHPWKAPLPVFTADRNVTVGPVWRRRFNGKWQYRQRKEKDDPDLTVW